MILVKGGDVVLFLDDEETFVLPRSYGMIHDESGQELDRCSLFLGPFVDAGPFEGEIPKVALHYFGHDYKPRIAEFDVPGGQWESSGQVREILYYRPGAYEDDWRHAFSQAVPLLRSGEWYRLQLPKGKVNWRGIVKP